jgi:photosystem II stability/assembly factor-like uncharacterized protein
LYKSVDHGGTFTPLPLSGSVFPMYENIVEMAPDTFLGNGLYEDLYISTDGGLSWTRNPDQYTATYAGNLTQSGSRLLFSRESSVGIVASDNGGSTWLTTNNGLTAFGGVAYFVDNLTSVGDTLYVLANADPFSEKAMLYQSADHGNTWSACPIPSPYDNKDDYLFAGQCDSLLLVDYFDVTHLTHELIYRSHGSWFKTGISNQYPAFLKGKKNHLFAFYATSDWEIGRASCRERVLRLV